MFHHFHSEQHHHAQGSLSEKQFRNILIWLKDNYELIGAEDYKYKFLTGKLLPEHICLSFDDALKCQYDIALSILEEFKTDAFFFVYSSAFTDQPDYLEIFRLFRTSVFKSIDEFYLKFFDILKKLESNEFDFQKSIFLKQNYLSEFPFYSDNDRFFRFLRDQYLGSFRYTEIMKDMMHFYKFDIDAAKKNLWMSENELREISKLGHTIGLHSYSHPTQISKLTRYEQESEYKKNYFHLSKIINRSIEVMSHPCGDYNEDTLSILKDIGINMGFRSNMSIPIIKSPLEIPREDHSNVFKNMFL